MSSQQQNLTDITRGMHHAAASTAAMLAQQYLRVIDQFFDVEEDGVMTAKMVKVIVDAQHYMMVPLISLVSPKGLALERMEVEMSVKIDEAELKMATDDCDNSKATRASFKVTMSPRSNVQGASRSSELTDIKMIFTAGEPPEGVNRIIEEYTSMIRPLPRGNGEAKKFHVIGKNGANGSGFSGEAGPAASAISAASSISGASAASGFSGAAMAFSPSGFSGGSGFSGQ
jgi:hypothetical protein